MKVFLNASLSGKKEFEEYYRRIFDSLKKNGHKVVSPVMEGEKDRVSQETSDEAEKYYDKLSSAIAAADVLVFEVSYPSTGIGHEITLGLSRGKPVVVLYLKERDPYILESMNDDRLQVLEYSLERGFEKLLNGALQYAAEQQDTRFNFFVSPRISAYLDWVSRKKKVPRAVYLRGLIKKDMEKEGDYQR